MGIVKNQIQTIPIMQLINNHKYNNALSILDSFIF